MKKVNSIIEKFFDWNFFWSENSDRKFLIEQRAEEFQHSYPNLLSDIMDNFRASFVDWKIYHTNYFLTRDRCLFFEIEEKYSGNKYIFGISIFEYFFMLEVSRAREELIESNDSINSFNQNISFVDKSSSALCDSMYDTVLKAYSGKFEWLPGEVLGTVVSQLSLDDGDEIMITRTVFNCITSFGVERGF